jgi:CRISPR-associated endonuclease Cas2
MILVTYDVNTESDGGKTRLRKVAKVCMNYGQRVQNSVFECMLDPAQFVSLKDSLSKIINHLVTEGEILTMKRRAGAGSRRLFYLEPTRPAACGFFIPVQKSHQKIRLKALALRIHRVPEQGWYGRLRSLPGAIPVKTSPPAGSSSRFPLNFASFRSHMPVLPAS